MSEEILYIDDGELVYYINENEFITCDEIPYPMLEGIKHLQQKVEQLEKDKSYANWYAVKKEKKVEQLENIRKEAIEYINNNNHIDGCLIKWEVADLLNILNKGSNKE